METTTALPRWKFAHCGLFIASLAAVSSLPALAAESAVPDKSRYSLFNPTPRELMREMSTDRPDKTESAYTLDAGHFQIEMDLLTYGYDRHNAERTDTRVESFSLAPINLKAGLLNNVDLQVVLEPYTSVRLHDRPARTVVRNRGFGDITPRLKINLWGNDGGDTALAVMPFVKIPTNQDDLGNDSLEGGIILPFAMSLPSDWSMGVMPEVDFIRDEAGRGYHTDFIHTITFGHDIAGKLAGYIEFFSQVSTASDSHWVGTVDVGFTYALTENIQFDAGVNFGVTRSADDVNPFIGLSWRF